MLNPDVLINPLFRLDEKGSNRLIGYKTPFTVSD